VSPAPCEPDGAAFAKLIEAGIPVNLQDAAEPGQMGSGTLGFAIGAIEIDRCRRIRALPGPVIPGVDPESTGLGAAPARIQRRGVPAARRDKSHDLGWD
jgi:hypothetical protein